MQLRASNRTYVEKYCTRTARKLFTALPFNIYNYIISDLLFGVKIQKNIKSREQCFNRIGNELFRN